MQSDTSSARAAFAVIVSRGATSAEIAQTAHEVWQHIDASLAPIIGHRGVAALYLRTIHLLRHVHSPLPVLDADATSVDILAELQRAGARETSESVAEMNAAMLETFRDVLARLIGASLTERLLQPAWERLAGAAAPQDCPR